MSWKKISRKIATIPLHLSLPLPSHGSIVAGKINNPSLAALWSPKPKGNIKLERRFVEFVARLTTTAELVEMMEAQTLVSSSLFPAFQFRAILTLDWPLPEGNDYFLWHVDFLADWIFLIRNTENEGRPLSHFGICLSCIVKKWGQL